MPLIFGRSATDQLLAVLVDASGQILGSVAVTSLPALPAGDNNIGNVDVVTLPSIPAGSNNIGDVDVASLPAIPAGSNNIGDVDVLTLPAIPAGSNLIGKIEAQSHGYVSGAFQNDPLRFGYSAGVYRSVVNAALPAGGSNQDDSAVPAGEIWVITSMAFMYTGTPPGRVRINLMNGAVVYMLYQQLAPASGVMYDRQGWWVMSPGDFLRVNLTTATLNDDLDFYAVGFRVDVDQ